MIRIRYNSSVSRAVASSQRFCQISPLVYSRLLSSTSQPAPNRHDRPEPLPFYDTHEEQTELYGKRSRQTPFVATRSMGLFPLVDCERSLDQALKSKVFQQNWFAADYDVDLVNAPTTLTITETEIERQRLEKLAKQNKKDTPKKDTAFSRVMAAAKVALAVYKSGIKHVWVNRKEAKRLLKKYEAKNKNDVTDAVLEHYFYTQVATHKRIFSTVTGEMTLHKRDKEIARDRENRRTISVNIVPASEEALTRAEYQLLLRTARDFPKLPIFVLIFCICFEFTPLIVLAFPQVLPNTCVIPSQGRKIMQARSKAARDLLKYKGDIQPTHSAYHLTKDQLHAVSKALKLTSSSIPVSVYPSSWLQIRVENHMKQVRADDILIAKSGGAWKMSLEELQQACLDRGIPVVDADGNAYSADWLRVNIFYWIVNYSRGRYDAGYLFADFEDLLPDEASQVMYLRDEYDWSIVNLKRP